MTGSDETSVAAGERRVLPLEDPWLLTSRVTIPERIHGYLRRPQLLGRCQPLNRHLTVFHAPCGFGKTTLLTDICHRERARGVLTAWLSLDETDSLDTLAAYIEFALGHAGLDPSTQRSAVRQSSQTIDHPVHAALGRMGLVMRAIEDYRRPCLIALDEVERLVDAEQIRLIDFLLRRAPRNLHLAMTMRNSPPGLDLASAVVDGRGTILRVDDLRFAKPEIALFFGGQLSRSELAEMTEETEGWPAALRIHLNMRTRAATPGNGEQAPVAGTLRRYEGIAARSIRSRIRRDLKDEERDYLLDVSLFDAIELEMVEEVLPETHSKWGVETLSKLKGLVQPVDASAGGRGKAGGRQPGGRTGEEVLRLHPLVQEYCAARRAQESPARSQMLHGRIALAMARRGRLDSALRHAGESGDHGLVGEILEGAGGVRMWARYGMDQLLTSDRFLTAEVIEGFPRLAFLRCSALMARSEMQRAFELYMAVHKKTRGFRRDRAGGDDRALQIDSVLVQSTWLVFGCQPLGSEVVRQALADTHELVTDGQLDPASRGLLYAILCAVNCQRARFESGHWLGIQAKQCFALANARYGAVFVDFLLGMAAMAEGRINDAAQSFARRSPALISRVLMAELYLERNQLKAHRRAESGSIVPLRVVEKSLDIHAAAYGVAAELAFERDGADGALQVVEDALGFAVANGLPSLVRHLSALRVSYLVTGGRVEQATRLWRQANLPECEAELLDMDHQSWREVESISCARVRLLAAQGEFEAARRLAERLREVARERGLMRTQMRCVALWMSAEYRAGNMNAAASRLLEFLRLLRKADYARPLVREREVSASLLRRLVGTAIDPGLRTSAESILKQLSAENPARTERTSPYTTRELEVLERLERGLSDKRIARHLGLTEHGVRYHLKNIFRKIGASNRMDAAQRARALGIIAES